MKNVMKAQEKEIEIVVTYKCNWNCSYCCVDTHNQPEPTTNEVDNKFLKITKDSNITLSGGEVGLLSKDRIVSILNKLKEIGVASISLNTNGLFLKKYPELIEEFQTILYHSSPELDEDDEILRFPDNKNIEYLLIVTDDILPKLDKFLSKNSDLIFNVVGASNPIGINKPILSKENRRFLMKKFSNRITKESALRLIIEKKFDEIIYL